MKDKRIDTYWLVELGALTAITLIMAYTPLGYLPLGALSISLLSIPVAVGAMVLGPMAGLFLGLVFGVTSFMKSFGGSAFMSALFAINPFGVFVTCVVARVLMGFCTGLIFKAVKKVDKSKIFCYAVGGFSAAFLNTVFFMGSLILFFYYSDTIQTTMTSLGTTSLLPFLIAFVGVNGAVEWPTSAIVGGAIAKVLDKFLKKNRH